jgi:transposase
MPPHGLITKLPWKDPHLLLIRDARYRRIVAHRGKKRALVALEHSILTTIWHMFTHDAEYADLGVQFFIERTGRARQT